MKREVDINMPGQVHNVEEKKKPYETSSLNFTTKNSYSMANTKLDKGKRKVVVANYDVK